MRDCNETPFSAESFDSSCEDEFRRGRDQVTERSRINQVDSAFLMQRRIDFRKASTMQDEDRRSVTRSTHRYECSANCV